MKNRSTIYMLTFYLIGDCSVVLYIYQYTLNQPILHKTSPPSFFCTASLISIMVSLFLTNINSPGCNGFTFLITEPEHSFFKSLFSKTIRKLGLEINWHLFKIGLFSLYFRPSHNLLVEMLSGVTSTYSLSGPMVEPFCRDEMNPCL